jgi:hypothetical protein
LFIDLVRQVRDIARKRLPALPRLRFIERVSDRQL